MKTQTQWPTPTGERAQQIAVTHGDVGRLWSELGLPSMVSRHWNIFHQRFLPAILAAHPNAQPASPERKPLTDEQISKGCNYAIELSNEIERAAFRKGVKFAEDAHRIAATQEPRT